MRGHASGISYHGGAYSVVPPNFSRIDFNLYNRFLLKRFGIPSPFLFHHFLLILDFFRVQ